MSHFESDDIAIGSHLKWFATHLKFSNECEWVTWTWALSSNGWNDAIGRHTQYDDTCGGVANWVNYIATASSNSQQQQQQQHTIYDIRIYLNIFPFILCDDDCEQMYIYSICTAYDSFWVAFTKCLSIPFIDYDYYSSPRHRHRHIVVDSVVLIFFSVCFVFSSFPFTIPNLHMYFFSLQIAFHIVHCTRIGDAIIFLSFVLRSNEETLAKQHTQTVHICHLKPSQQPEQTTRAIE